MTTAAITAPLPQVPAGNDFGDWLSPILVKELRQGLKTKVFVGTFILVQAVMVVLVGLQLLTHASGAGRGAMEAFDAFFWAFVWIPLLLLMPARGLTAVSEEVKASTLDLVQLTRLTSFRIVLGKWIALVAQTILLVAAILPYAVLRYFFGEVDIVSDLTQIGWMLAASMVLTAGAVALSSTPLVIRILVLMVGLPMAFSSLVSIGLMRAMGGVGASTPGTDGWWLVFPIAAANIYMLLEIAASRIAPEAENHAFRKRAVALLAGAVSPLIFLFMNESAIAFWMIGFVPLWSWTMLEALCERTVMVPSLYRPFARRGFLGRLAGRLFYPGWASGVLFVALLFSWVSASIYYSIVVKTPADAEPVVPALVLPLALTSILLPVLILRFFPRLKQPAWLYILIQALFLLVYIIANVVAQSKSYSTRDEFFRWLAPFPLSAFFALMDRGLESSLAHTYSIITLPVAGVLGICLVIVILREFGKIRRLEKEAVATHDAVQS